MQEHSGWLSQRVDCAVYCVMTMFSDDLSPVDDAEHYRTRLFGIAYRMLSDVQEAEDLVQETFLRWNQAKHDDIVSAEGWLVAVITRLSIDRLRRAETERLRYVGNWLPEPIATADVLPDHRVELASDLSMAFSCPARAVGSRGEGRVSLARSIRRRLRRDRAHPRQERASR